MTGHNPSLDYQQLADDIKAWGQELGFQKIAISDARTGEHEGHLERWLASGFHGEMEYMARHGTKRSRPPELQPGTQRVISARMDYLAADTQMVEVLQDKSKAYISRYTLGRDYHKLIRKRLTTLGKRVQEKIGPYGFRAFVDSAPVLEKALAEQAGLGWIGKHTLLLDRSAGSWFFLGEIYTDLPLPVDEPVSKHCGKCSACIDICPTQAIVAPYQLDARRCISYLTIEHKGPIPEPLREAMGNRIFGCDDCQIGCPWNRFSKTTAEQDFSPRHQLDKATLLELFAWDEATFLKRTEGMPIRRTGFENWQRNIAVALGNAPTSLEVIDALEKARSASTELVRQHIDWALQQHQK